MAGRIRTVKPPLFTHEGLFDLEAETGFPIRTAFMGLITQCDREGRFEWRPRPLKVAILPYDTLDFGDVLEALERGGFIEKYEVDGKVYGWIPTFSKHQRVNTREAQSEIPPPPSTREENAEQCNARASTCKDDAKHRNARASTKIMEGNRNRNRKGNPPTPLEGGGDLNGRVWSSISRADLGVRSAVLAWAERNIPDLSEDLRLKVLACSVRARNVGKDPPKLFLNLVKTGLTEGLWRIDSADEEAASKPLRRHTNPPTGESEPEPVGTILSEVNR